MKKFLLLLIFFNLTIFSNLFAHGQGVHQHMVRQAYEVLKTIYGGDIPILQDHVGFNEQGTIVFDPGNLLVIGAYREDEEDAVYWNYGQPGGFAVTNTHFYEPDGGENWHFVVLGATYENAYQKALKYIYGGYELRVPYPGASIIECYDAPTNLFEWYKNGSIYYKGFIDMTVPAHVHGDRHWPDLDTYEEWMNNPTVYNNYTASTGLSQGNIFDLSN